MIKVTYISHSGFLVELDDAYFLFDYYKGEIPEFDPKKEVYVYVSHGHYDHFNHQIFNLLKRENQTYFILSDDIQIEGFKEVSLVAPDVKLTIGDCQITTFISTDLGVAFLVDYKGFKIYHGGDLNWWHWNGESDEYNEVMEVNYKKEMAKLKREKIDIAFVALDPRLGDACLLGLDYFMDQTDTKLVFPMHFGEEYNIISNILDDNRTKEYRNEIICIDREGEEFCL